MSLSFYKNIKNEIDTKKYLYLSSGYGSNVTSTQIQYINNGFDIYVILPENSKIAQQVIYNPEVQVVFDTASAGKSKGIILQGIIEKIEGKDENIEFAKKFTRRFRRFKNYFFSRQTFVYKISPVEIKRIQFDQQSDENVLTFKENDRSSMQKLWFKFKTLLKTWREATRISFATASLSSVLLGNAIAWSLTGSFSLNLFLLTLLGTLLVHLGANMLNDYHDHLTGNDTKNLFYNELTGGSRVIQSGVFSLEKVLISSILLLLFGSGIGLYLNFILPGNLLLFIGIIGLFLGFGYSIPVLKFCYRGLGELSVGIAFGLLVTLGSYFVQAGSFSWLPVIASAPLIFLVFLILFINEFQDYRADKNSNKKTLVVRIGDKWKAMKVFSVLLFVPYIWIIVFSILGLLPYWSLLTLLTLPLAILAVRQGSVKYRKIYELLIVNKLTITIHLATAILLSLGFLLDKII